MPPLSIIQCQMMALAGAPTAISQQLDKASCGFDLLLAFVLCATESSERLLLFLPTTFCTLSTLIAQARQFPQVQIKEANVNVPYCLQT